MTSSSYPLASAKSCSILALSFSDFVFIFLKLSICSPRSLMLLFCLDLSAARVSSNTMFESSISSLASSQPSQLISFLLVKLNLSCFIQSSIFSCPAIPFNRFSFLFPPSFLSFLREIQIQIPTNLHFIQRFYFAFTFQRFSFLMISCNVLLLFLKFQDQLTLPSETYLLSKYLFGCPLQLCPPQKFSTVDSYIFMSSLRQAASVG